MISNKQTSVRLVLDWLVEKNTSSAIIKIRTTLCVITTLLSKTLWSTQRKSTRQRI